MLYENRIAEIPRESYENIACERCPRVSEWCANAMRMSMIDWQLCGWLMNVQAKESWEMDPPEKLEQSELSKNKGTGYFKVRVHCYHHFVLSHQVVSLHLQWWSSMPDQPTSTYRNYPGTVSNPIWAYCPIGQQYRREADLDFLTFCVLEETTRMTADDLDEDGAEWPQLPRAVMDRRSRSGPQPTTLEAVGDQWCYALVVVQVGHDDDHHFILRCCGC